MRLRLLALLLAFTSAAVAQQTTLPLWPHGTPEPAQTTAPETDVTKPTDALISGHRSQRLTNVTVPTLSVYPPHGHNTGAAALVFPGGGYVRLAWTGEGTDTCEWLNSVGLTCILVKYRVPQPDGAAGHFPADPADLEDAQQAMRLTRAHAAEWHIDPSRIGVVGFSAGGNLAVLLSTHPTDHHVESTPAAADVPGVRGKLNGDSMLTDATDARANFAILAYPAYLALDPGQTALDSVYAPNAFTPPTFLIAAENDLRYGVNALVYYRALVDSKHPAELHMYDTGGHGFGMHPAGKPEEHWIELATNWLREIGILSPLPARPADAGAATGSPTGGQPCPIPQPPVPGRPSPNLPPNPDPNCF